MGQKIMAHENAKITMGPDESLLILIRHCQDMKQQEMRLRLITLFLLFGCAAFFIFSMHADFKQRQNSESSGQQGAVVESPACSRQESGSPTDHPQTHSERLRIHLNSVSAQSDSEMTDGQYMKWKPVFGRNDFYNASDHAIVIPENGYYSLYLSVTLRCQTNDSGFKMFTVKLHKWRKDYCKVSDMVTVFDGLMCRSTESRHVFVGQLFEMMAGDHVKVWIKEGYKLIHKSSIGAYLT